MKTSELRVKTDGGDTLYIYDLGMYPSLHDFKANDDVELIMFDNRNQEKRYSFKFSTIEKINSTEINTITELKEKISEEEIEKIINVVKSKTNTSDPEKLKLLELNFYDYTENYICGDEVLGRDILEDKEQGLWTNYGKRKFLFEISNLANLEKIGDNDISLNTYFYKIDNRDLEEKIEIKHLDYRKLNNKLEVYTEIDTDIFSRCFNDEEYAKISGKFEIEIEKEKEFKTSFSIALIFHNLEKELSKEREKILHTEKVSIDFGTSSTCVAIKNNKFIEFLTLNKNNSTDNLMNKFENPTNLMIYRWEELFKEWNKNNIGLPLFLKGTLEDNSSGKEVIYDSGYGVKELIKDSEKRSLNAILTEIKLLPYELEKRELTLEPYRKGEKEIIKLVKDFNEEDEEHFDPISFYAYLLGRVINKPKNKKIYTKFLITYPVKFKDELREQLRKSIEYGLKRSLPISLRDEVDKNGKKIFSVEMKYSEPVAYIGAICGSYLKTKGTEPQYFAVYDFGGGTLDFSFGYVIDEGDDTVVEILGVAGDETIGGERLISRMSYWLYSSFNNVEKFMEKQIPFERLETEKITDEIDEDLLILNNIAKLNTRKINENISRLIFEGREEEVLEDIDLQLFNKNGEIVDIALTTEKTILNEKLKEIFEENVENFYCSLKETLEKNSSKLKNIDDKHKKENSIENLIERVNIFKSGNAAKNKLLKEVMLDKFKDNKIELVDETIDRKKEKKYAITPKTAVAYGQLNMGSFILRQEKIEETPFLWNIYKYNVGKNALVCLISRQEINNEWVKFGRITNEKVEIFYSSSGIRKKENCATKDIDFSEEENGKYLFIKKCDERSIYYLTNDEEKINITEINEEKIKKLILE